MKTIMKKRNIISGRTDLHTHPAWREIYSMGIGSISEILSYDGVMEFKEKHLHSLILKIFNKFLHGLAEIETVEEFVKTTKKFFVPMKKSNSL